MDPLPVVRCIILSSDASRAEALARALHSHHGGVVVSAATDPRLAAEWIRSDPTGMVAVIALLDDAADEELMMFAAETRRKHPHVAIVGPAHLAELFGASVLPVAPGAVGAEERIRAALLDRVRMK